MSDLGELHKRLTGLRDEAENEWLISGFGTDRANIAYGKMTAFNAAITIVEGLMNRELEG